MAASIRLHRKGQKKQPYYRIVVIDTSAGSSAEPIARLGTFNPEAGGEEESLNLDEDAALEWMRNGAMPSDTVRDLFVERGLMETLRGTGTAAEG